MRLHVSWLVPLHVNDDLHGKYLHFTRENTRAISRVREVIIAVP